MSVPERLISQLARTIPPQNARSFLREYMELSEYEIQREEQNVSDFETLLFRMMLKFVHKHPAKSKKQVYEAFEGAYISGLFDERWYSDLFPEFPPMGEPEPIIKKSSTSSMLPPRYSGEPIIQSASDAEQVIRLNGHDGFEARTNYVGKCAYKRHMLEYHLEGTMKIYKWVPQLKWSCRVKDQISQIAAKSGWYESRTGALEHALKELLPKLND